MPFGTWTLVVARKHVLDEGHSGSPHVKGQFWRQNGAGPGRARWSIYSKWLSGGQHRYGADAYPTRDGKQVPTKVRWCSAARE